MEFLSLLRQLCIGVGLLLDDQAEAKLIDDDPCEVTQRPFFASVEIARLGIDGAERSKADVVVDDQRSSA